MRPFVIVEPDEAFDRTAAMPEGPLALKTQALVIDRAEEPLDFAVGLRPARPEQVMRDVQTPTRLFEPGQPIAMPRVLHRERQGVVGQDGLNAIRQPPDDLLEK